MIWDKYQLEADLQYIWLSDPSRTTTLILQARVVVDCFRSKLSPMLERPSQSSHLSLIENQRQGLKSVKNVKADTQKTLAEKGGSTKYWVRDAEYKWITIFAF